MIKGMASRQETAGLRRYTDAIAPYTIPLLRILVGITFLLTGLPKFGNLAGFEEFPFLTYNCPGISQIRLRCFDIPFCHADRSQCFIGIH